MRVLAIVIVVVAKFTNGDVGRAILGAAAFFVVATAWSWWRFRPASRAGSAAGDRGRHARRNGRGAVRRPFDDPAPRGTGAQRSVVGDRGAASDAAQQSRRRRGRASRAADRLRRLRQSRPQPRGIEGDRRVIAAARRRRDASGAERQAGGSLPNASGRSACPDCQFACLSRTGRPGTSSGGSRHSA